MKNILILILSVFFVHAFSQTSSDSIFVPVFDYSMTTGIGDRVSMANFPTSGDTYEKIFLLYNLRCKNGNISSSTNRNFGCGEWDYSCNTYLEDSTRADSILATITNLRFIGYVGDTLKYSTQQAYDFLAKIVNHTNLYSIVSENQYTIAANNSSITTAFPLANYNSKSQFLYKASELSSAGISSGNINGLILDVNNNINSNICKIKIKSTTKTALSSSDIDTGGFTLVFNDSLYLPTTPSNRLLFHNPYPWNGTDNIIVEFTYTNNNSGISATIKGNSTSFISGIYSSNDFTPNFVGGNYININGYKGVGGAQSRTVEAWIKTSTSNKEILSWGSGDNSKKWVFRLNSNGAIRAEVGGGFKFGTTNLADGQWHHVACTFNGTNITQANLYVDGVLEGNGGSQSALVSTESAGTDVTIGWGINNTYFVGDIDNVRIWSTDLSNAEISDWKNKKMSSNHPKYAFLEASYSAETAAGNLWNDESTNARHAEFKNRTWFNTIQGEKIIKNFSEQNSRPDIKFLKGTYNTTSILDTIYIQVPQIPVFVQTCNITSMVGSIVSDILNYSPPTAYWPTTPGNRYFDENNNLISSTNLNQAGVMYYNSLPYWRRYPMRLELMSFVTPYGINLDLGMDGKTWGFDMTDFATELKGSKRIIVNKGGQWQEDMDMKFLFVKGTPPRTIKAISNIWYSDRQTNYTDIISNAQFEPRTIALKSDATAFKLKSSITGHGQEGEFIPRTHFLNVNNASSPQFSWDAWKVCGQNPIFPQGGTWIYDRAGWCPGMATDLQEFDITPLVSPGANATIDYGINSATGDSRYIISNMLVQYGSPNFTLDARIKDIISPSNKVEYLKENPNCFSPVVVLQNTGNTTLTSADIKYWINNSSSTRTYHWTGNLKFNESTQVTLPVDDYFWQNNVSSTNNTFYAEVLKANTLVDDYVRNNKLNSKFDVTNVLPEDVVFLIRSNSAPSETGYYIIKSTGDTIYKKIITTANTLVRDTVHIDGGCYSLVITDNDGDGISFWANNDGVGYFRIYKATSSTLLKTLQPDFGNSIKYNFTVNWPLSYEQIHSTWDYKLYPNPSSAFVNVQAYKIEDAQYELFNTLGQIIHAPISKQKNEIKIDVNKLPLGTYYFKANLNDKSIYDKILIQ